MRCAIVGNIFLAALVFLPHAALAEQVIHAYSSHIELKQDDSATVQEEIVYDFGSEQHHGIYRVIPLSVKALGKIEYSSLDISSILVTDGHGKRLTTSYDKGGNSITLTIGDKDTLVSGEQLYVIRYTLWGAVSANLISDQFDWDATGPTWNAPIDRLRAEVVFPKNVTPTKIVSRCGLIYDNGKSDDCAASSILGTSTESGYMVRFEASNTPPRTGFIIQSTFQKGAIVFRQKNALASENGTREFGIVKWWTLPFLDLSLVVPFIIFFALLSLFLEGGKWRHSVRAKQSYLLSGIALILLSFVVPNYNLATLASGMLLLGFGVFLHATRK